MAAMAEDLPPPLTLQQRIAALNASQGGPMSGDSHLATPACPQIPTKRRDRPKQTAVNHPLQSVKKIIQVAGGGATVGASKPAPPPLPIRKHPPPLPARKDSADSDRRPSFESLSSTVTSGSDTSRSAAGTSRSTSSDRIKAPAWGECELPPLPPRGQSLQPHKFSTEKAKYINRVPSSDHTQAVAPASSWPVKQSPRPALPPRLPPRNASLVDPPVEQSTPAQNLVKRSALSYALNKTQSVPEIIKQPSLSIPNLRPAVAQTTPSLPTIASLGLPRTNSQPPLTLKPLVQPSWPPPPVSPKPDISGILATKPKPKPSPKPAVFNAPVVNHSYLSDTAGCLVCRDFSLADSHATRFPRQSVSRLQDLASQLTAPFPSATDKARAICTWLHLNIAYDVDNFFRGTVKGSSPESTLQSGLAVCEGYAALFSRLATYAGLESVVISGHGKGFGFAPLAPGSALPRFEGNHAWNAVRIDGGEWKLIDSCWYSGHIQGPGMPFVAKRNDSMFTMTNQEFGIKHFPNNGDHFFLPGLPPMTWEEYIQINPDHWPYGFQPPLIYTAAEEEYFIGKHTVTPQTRQVSTRQGGHVRFQFGLRCPHWDLAKHTQFGPPPVFLMQIQGLDGRKTDLVPFEHASSTGGQGGDLWYVDIPAIELGAPGQTISCFAITKFGDSTDCRGLSVGEFKSKKGTVGMAFAGVMAWDLIA